MGDVRGECRDNTQAEEPPRQRGHPHTPPRRVQHHHRARVDETVDRQRNQTPGPASLTVHPHQSRSVLVGHNSSDSSDADYSRAVDHLITRSTEFITHHRRPARTPPWAAMGFFWCSPPHGRTPGRAWRSPSHPLGASPALPNIHARHDGRPGV